ncbi:keratin, type I cytoskeletal 17-like [Discoglossus pictus]
MSHNSKPTYSAPGNFSVSSLSPKLPRYGSSIQPRGFRKVHVGGPIRPIRFQEASRAKESAIVRYHSFSHGLDYGCSHGGFSKECPLNRKNDGLLSSSEKETMQLLNDRLASYLEKVRSLQQDNAQLERKIRDWYDKQHPQTLPDFNHYFGTVEELQKKILLSAAENARMARQVDNVRLAADDFRKKSEIEQKMRSFVELDVKTLHKELGQLKIETQDLEMLHQDLQHNLLYMKKNNEDTVNSLNTQLGARVSVEVEVPPAIDLTKLLSDIREQYEELMENNKIEAENWFLAKTKELSCEVQTESQYPQISKSNLIELKRTIQTQEIELQSQRSMSFDTKLFQSQSDCSEYRKWR